MTDPVARLVNPPLDLVLGLGDAWGGPAGPAFDAGRDALAGRFRPLFAAHPPAGGADLGLAYPVACLADELLTRHPLAGRKWTERKIEAEFYGTNDRAWQFWRQADLAAGRDDDRLEVVFACVGLGFRGEKADDPAAIRAWLAAHRDRVVSRLKPAPDRPPSLDPPTPAGPLTGRASLRRAVVAAVAGLAVGAPAAAALLARALAR